MHKEWKKKREDSGLTISEVARRTGLTRNMISMFENQGKNISLDNFNKMLHVVNAKLIIVDDNGESNEQDGTPGKGFLSHTW